jgi:antimicrobial peptide system SdpA family protein
MIPQGWGFFSKSPRDTTLYVEELDGAKDIQWPNNSPSNLFGIKRTGRSQGVELGLLRTKLQDADWVSCKNGIDECKNDLKFIQVTNETPKPTVCGKYILYEQEPIPWAWNSMVTVENNSSNAVKVDIEC